MLIDAVTRQSELMANRSAGGRSCRNTDRVKVKKPLALSENQRFVALIANICLRFLKSSIIPYITFINFS